MKKAIVFVDGMNFMSKVKEILNTQKVQNPNIDINKIKLKNLITEIFQSDKNISVDEIRFYSAKLSQHPKTIVKSRSLIAEQRTLKTTLENNGINFIISGHVRGNEIFENGITKVIFKEKGVDVRIAVDMVSMACDKTVDTIVLCSSDSDLQPAVKEVKARGVEVIYVGFSINPNKGLQITTDQTILFRDPEIINAISP